MLAVWSGGEGDVRVQAVGVGVLKLFVAICEASQQGLHVDDQESAVRKG
jgi:hypothetical protein